VRYNHFMNKNFQVTDKPSKKLNRIYKRMSGNPTTEDFQYVKIKIKEAASPLDEVNNLLQNSDRIYKRDMKWSSYGMWGVFLFIFTICAVFASLEGIDALYNQGYRILITVLLCISGIVGIKSGARNMYKANTACLKRIRVELERESKRLQNNFFTLIYLKQKFYE
ncbi:MAG: hypothetical protein LIO65_09465, partial [Odoribacter sp.]|nr:hypothetical protein [Odoribacter sp.]